MIHKERITRQIDAAPCDWCGNDLGLNDLVLIDLAQGTIFCSRHCHREHERPQVLTTRFDMVHEVG